MDLYMYYLGGTVAGANIEVHDMQFAVAEQPEDGFPEVAESWFGDKGRLHVDVITRVNWADGYDIHIGDQIEDAGPRLFFVNMGAYLEGDVYERHSFELVAAKDLADAKVKVRNRFLLDHLIPHRDNLVDVDNAIALLRISGRNIVLKPNPEGIAEKPLFQGYQAIGANRRVYDPGANALVDSVTGARET